MKINEKQLPIKYFLKIYSTLPGYPSNEDILFELCQDKNILNKLDFDYKYIKYLTSFKLSKETFNDFILNALQNNWVDQTSENFYQIKKIDWLNEEDSDL